MARSTAGPDDLVNGFALGAVVSCHCQIDRYVSAVNGRSPRACAPHSGRERGKVDDQRDIILYRSAIGDQLAVLAYTQHRHPQAAQRPLHHHLLDPVPIRADHYHHHGLRPSLTLTGVEPVYRRELPGAPSGPTHKRLHGVRPNSKTSSRPSATTRTPWTTTVEDAPILVGRATQRRDQRDERRLARTDRAEHAAIPSLEMPAPQQFAVRGPPAMLG
jgi:hypothetical protein